jgi:post-segregation antitoxin (ccd killing protein)
MKRRQVSSHSKRRTTLTLPADSLTQAASIARARKVNLSTVISEALANGLQAYAATQRSEEILSAYKKAFTGFSEEELLLLDGVVLDPPRKRR